MQQNLKGKVKQGLYLIPALRLVWGAAPNWTAARLILLLTQGLLPIASLYLTKLIIDGISTSFPTANTANINNPITTFQELIPLLLLAGAIALLGMMLTSLTEVVNTAQSEKVTNFMQDLLHGKSIEVDLEYYENPQYHDTLQRAQHEASFRPNRILTLLAEVLQNGIALVALTGLLFSLYWGVAAVLFVATLPRAFVRVKYARVLYQWQRKRTALQRQARYLSLLLTGEMFAKEVRLFDLGALFRSRFRNLQEKIYQERLAIATKQAIINFSTQVLGGGFLLAASGYIVYQAVQGAITLGDLALYYQAMQRGQSSLKQFLTSLSGLYENNLFLKNLYEFLELKPKVLEPKNTRVLPQVLRRGIVFDRVSFHYPNTQRQALHEINLRVAPGETIALVGENGSGKTTLIKLLCRLYDPTAGNIYLEGVNLRDFSVSDLRRQISIIFQDYAKYHFSAQDNIGLGNLDLLPSLKEIEAAARRSGADALIRQLPQGYETILGKLFEQGEELSIGQWQKIALARAFLRSSQIIVLDEPTSAMDPKAEYEVFQQFRQLIQNTAAILISHRMSTVRIADRIYVMEQGRIVEWGTHSELIEKGDIYAQMFETQAGNYR
ncbi:MAG: ABC transporter ATP-binding protein [Prochloron sp. SP5CPC1]|nr:ABC transporter ATP-binding protein [Candidatus Paraprochloron terpiosi SP5CPC1]